jgi:hypothetical protein
MLRPARGIPASDTSRRHHVKDHIFCSAIGDLVWLHYNVPWLFGPPWLYPFRSVFDLLLLWLPEEIRQIDAISERHLRQ